MSDITNKSKSDRDLLWLCGFTDEKQRINNKKLALFCGVSVRTVQRWIYNGLPARVVNQLNQLKAGAFLPDTWRRSGMTVSHDGVLLRGARAVPLDVLKYWPLIARAVDWSRVKLPPG